LNRNADKNFEDFERIRLFFGKFYDIIFLVIQKNGGGTEVPFSIFQNG
jgi:hypothetical protein